MTTRPRAMLRQLHTWLPAILAYATSSGSLILANASQLVTFGFLARSLGSDQFGLLVSFTAVTSVAVHLCGLGAGEGIVRRIAQDRESHSPLLGHSLILIAITGFFLVLAGIVVMPLWIEVSPDRMTNLLTIFLMLVTNILLVRLILLAEGIYLGHSRFAQANICIVFFAMARMAAAITACLLFKVDTVAEWAIWQFGCHILVLLCFVPGVFALGAPHFSIVREEVRLGVLFALPFIFRAIQQNADLMVLGMVADAEIVGSYGVARRIADSSHMATEALNRLFYPRLAAASTRSIDEIMGLSRKLALMAFGLGCLSAIAIVVLSPLLPMLFGKEYVSLVPFCRIISGTVIFVALWSAAADALGAASMHGPRALVLNIGNGLGSILIAWATWYMPPQGTFASLYLIEIAITIALWLTLVRLTRNVMPSATQPSASSTG